MRYASKWFNFDLVTILCTGTLSSDEPINSLLTEVRPFYSAAFFFVLLATISPERLEKSLTLPSLLNSIFMQKIYYVTDIKSSFHKVHYNLNRSLWCKQLCEKT